MGQYWIPINLSKREYLRPHKLGTGLKLWEQLASSPGTGAALIILTAAMPELRGGGDFDLDKNWHGPERTNKSEYNAMPAPMPEEYQKIAKRTIGRWAGDRIAIVGDYAELSDLPQKFNADLIYGLCGKSEEEIKDWADGSEKEDPMLADRIRGSKPFKDITDDVCRVIEHELNGKFDGSGWRKFKQKGE